MHMLTHENKTKRLVNDFENVIEHVEALLNITSDQTGELFNELKEKVEESLHKAKHGLADAQDIVMEKSKEAIKSTDEYVHDNPWVSIGAAAAFGMIVGMYLGSRK